MPFVADLDGERVDLTQRDDAVWSTIWRARLGPRLSCPECGATVRAKPMSSTRTRFVAHASGDVRPCSLAGESAEHRFFKLQIVHMLRARGWAAEPEAAGDGWRADVLATDPADVDRSIVFEIQLSTQTVDEAIRRQSVLTEAGNTVVWLVRRKPTWMRWVPTWCVQNSFDGHQVTDGLFVWSDHRETFVQAGPGTLGATVDRLLQGDLLWDPTLRVLGPERARLRNGPWPEGVGQGGWVGVDDVRQLRDLRNSIELRQRLLEAQPSACLEDRRHASPRLPTSVTRAQASTPPPKPGVASARIAALGTPIGGARDQELADRRMNAVERIRRISVDRSWTCQVFEGSERSFFGAIVVVEGRLLVVEPTGVRQGCWPGAVVIGNPVMAQAKRVDDLRVMTIDRWSATPLLGSCDLSLVLGRR